MVQEETKLPHVQNRSSIPEDKMPEVMLAISANEALEFSAFSERAEQSLHELFHIKRSHKNCSPCHHSSMICYTTILTIDSPYYKSDKIMKIISEFRENDTIIRMRCELIIEDYL
jgi:hypothetical protein